MLRLVPGGRGVHEHAVTRADTSRNNLDEVALWLGSAFAMVSLTTVMGQVERGANRLHGVERDRSSVAT